VSSLAEPQAIETQLRNEGVLAEWATQVTRDASGNIASYRIMNIRGVTYWFFTTKRTCENSLP